MSVLSLLIGASLVVAIAFLIAFVWAARNGQFEDMHTPSMRILFNSKKNKQDKKG